jgi:hypothetical protein
MVLKNKNTEEQCEKPRRKSREDGCGCVGKEEKMRAEN